MTAVPAGAPKLQTLGLRKAYPGTVALDDVSVSFAGGQVHALLGKNGAGKSTLVNIFAGSVYPTAGRVLVDGREVRFDSPADAFRNGIATVHQELSLVPDLTVAENIFLGRMPRRRTLAGVRRIDWPLCFSRARDLLDGLGGSDLDPRAVVRHLSVARQQIVEIAKAMSFSPSVLMLDEPTSALSDHETQRLFAVVRQLARTGVAILYITHRLQELRHVADTVTVLRDGRLVGSIPFDPDEPQTVLRMMFGDVTPEPRPDAGPPSGDAPPVLQVRSLSRGSKVRDVSFDVRRGEVLGIAGVLGSGRTELLRAIFGADRADGGTVLLDGRPADLRDPAAARDAGLALVPENRKTEGLVLPLSVRENFFLSSLRRMAPCGVSSARRERRVAAQWADRLAIKLPGLDAPVSALSGGNQQKVVVGKWLNATPRVILFDEPTRGIDLAAKRQIFHLMWDLARQGIACVVVSSELQELLEVCHRILIMKQGRLAGEARPDEVTAESLWLRCMTH